MDNDTLAAFLIGAGDDHYIASGGWSAKGKNPVGSRLPVLDLPLGEPTADGENSALRVRFRIDSRELAPGFNNRHREKFSFNALLATLLRRVVACVGMCGNAFAGEYDTKLWHRQFASGTKVQFNASCTPNRKAPTCPGTFITWKSTGLV